MHSFIELLAGTAAKWLYSEEYKTTSAPGIENHNFKTQLHFGSQLGSLTGCKQAYLQNKSTVNWRLSGPDRLIQLTAVRRTVFTDYISNWAPCIWSVDTSKSTFDLTLNLELLL